MPYLLAVDWDTQQARYVLATVANRKVRVSALGSEDVPAELPSRTEDDADDADEASGQVSPEEARNAWYAAWLDRVLKKHRVRSCRVLFALPRSGVELFTLSLPPTTEEELPELVENQAMQESTSITDDTILDFLPDQVEPGEPRRVTVAALQPEEVAAIRERCETGRRKLHRLLLRPMASLSLFRRLASDREAPALILSHVGTEADLNVVYQGRLVLTRTVRFPEEATDEEIFDRLLAEIQRTLLVTPRELLGDQSVERVSVIGGQADNAPLLEEIEQQLTLSAEFLDPFAVTGVKEARVPAHRERFAPLLGMLLDEALGTQPVDFLHPRRSPQKLAPWKVATAAFGALALVGLIVGVFVWGELSEVREENAALRQRLRELNEIARRAVRQRDRIEAVSDWRNRDVQWLDELRDLSVRFPPSRDAVVTRMTMRPSQRRGGMIDLQGLVRDPNIVVNMERQIRDRYRNVRSRRIQQRALQDDYTWLFETSVSVLPRRAEEYRDPPPAEPDPTEDEVELEIVDGEVEILDPEPPAAAPNDDHSAEDLP